MLLDDIENIYSCVAGVIKVSCGVADYLIIPVRV